jgi:5-oxopent-3-ene-1,2,5-tricarboxylate decarboxylase / 2-hydroxyhepta-2,4-diene-1,7-dioate isomerase
MMLSTVYGSLMHHRTEWEQIGERAQQAPYLKPPQAPVLYIKPANTFLAFGQTLALPAGAERLQARSCLGWIFEEFGAPALAESHSHAINKRANASKMALLCDFTQEQPSLYRPPLRFNAFDGSLAMPQLWRPQRMDELRDARIETWVNGECVHAYHAADWIRPAFAQCEEVGRFIAWEAGDVLMMGCPSDAPWVKAGDWVEARMDGQVFTRTKIAQQEPV